MTSPLHTKLKELRELRGRATAGKWKVDRVGDVIAPSKHGGDTVKIVFTNNEHVMNDEDVDFVAQAANNWLTLISALEKAVVFIHGECICEIKKESTSPHNDYSKVICEPCRALAEIAEMLEGEVKTSSDLERCEAMETALTQHRQGQQEKLIRELVAALETISDHLGCIALVVGKKLLEKEIADVVIKKAREMGF